jgi:Fur family peroxide stress response transcriptional regulator
MERRGLEKKDTMGAQLQLTRQRAAVLAVVQEAEKHLTAQEVYDRVRQRLPSTAFGTVYNALACLQQAGLIQVINVGSGPALYDRNAVRHDHVVCRQCGKVLDYSLPDLEHAIEDVTRATGFRIQKAEVLFVGLCPACQFGVESSAGKTA